MILLPNFCYLKNVRRFLLFNLSFFYCFWFIFNFISFFTIGDFNFNGGKFTYEGVEYTINKTEDDDFYPCPLSWYLKECNLTIPSTIKSIGNRAFSGNSGNYFFSSKEIIDINFNERIEDIGTDAFKKCDDLKSNTLVLWNILQHTGNKFFRCKTFKTVRPN